MGSRYFEINFLLNLYLYLISLRVKTKFRVIIISFKSEHFRRENLLGRLRWNNLTIGIRDLNEYVLSRFLNNNHDR